MLELVAVITSKQASPVVRYIVTFFGVGYMKPAPGTWGTLATLPLALALNWLGPWWMMGAVAIITPLGIIAAENYQNQTGEHDRSEIVIDEVIGFLIAMTWLPITWQACVLGFFLFRLLDIWKPFPIGYLDRKIPGGVGVVADDIVAGIVTNIVLQLLYNQTNWLGAQILVR